MKIYKVKHKKTLRKVIALVLIMAITVQSVSQQEAAAKQKMRKTKQKTQESVLDKYGMIAMEKIYNCIAMKQNWQPIFMPEMMLSAPEPE